MSDVKKINGYNIKDAEARSEIETLNAKAKKFYDTVSDMIADTTLEEGMLVETKGYNSSDDKGAGEYIIVDKETSNVLDISLSNGLKAELLIKDNTININSLGADNTGTQDSSTLFNSVFEYIHDQWIEHGIDYPNVVVCCGKYLINNQIIMPPCAKLRNSGFVKFISNVDNDSMLLIDYLTDDLPEEEFSKQEYLSGSIIDFDKGSQIVYAGDKSTDNAIAIEIGSRTNLGVNYPISRYKIKNLTIKNFTIGILHNSYNVYIGSYDHVQLELNTINIQFGLYSQIGTASNQGERITFNDCIIGPSSIGVLFDGIGWETFYDNCSFDFCGIVFKQTTRDQNYWNKINVTNSHFEAFNKIATNFGVNEEIININNSDIYNSLNTQNFFDNCTNNKYFRDTLLHEKMDQNELDPETYISLDTNVFLDNTLSPRSSSMNKYFIKNNILKSFDEIEDGDVNITANQTVGPFKILEKWNVNSTAQIVTDNYLYQGHKSLLLTKSTSAENNGILNMETELLPLTNQEKLIVVPFFYNLHGSRQSRAILKFYDKDNNLVESKTSYEWFPSDPPSNEWSMNPYGFFENVPPTATQFQVFVSIPNFGSNDDIGTQYKIGGIIVNKR